MGKGALKSQCKFVLNISKFVVSNYEYQGLNTEVEPQNQSISPDQTNTPYHRNFLAIEKLENAVVNV